MTDWSKLKVVELKEECKSRDIPLTGLKLKQEYIDKLEAYEANQASSTNVSDGVENNATVDDPAHPNSSEINGDGYPGDAKQNGHSLNDETAAGQQKETEINVDVVRKQEKEPASSEDVPEGGSESPRISETNVAPTPSPSRSVDINVKDKPTDPIEDPRTGRIPEEHSPAAEPPTEQRNERDRPQDQTNNESSDQQPDTAAMDKPVSPQIPPAELADDQRKRKRRSLTPVPSSAEIAKKKLRANDGTSVVTEVDTSSSSEQVRSDQKPPQPRVEAEETESVVEVEKSPIAKNFTDGRAGITQNQEPEPGHTPRSRERFLRNTEGRDTDNLLIQERRSRSQSAERDVTPALHPATSSLYVRNFKRPLNLPALRAHVVSLAKPRSSPEDYDPIKTFFLDSIRTHALISFNSVNEASRVRSTMHDTKFPDEPMREPLFVDFVPDDSFQDWIDQETDGGRAGRGGSNKRFEIVYEDGINGVEAKLQEVDISREKPPLTQRRSTQLDVGNIRSPQQPPASAPAIAASIHPDRQGFVPRDDSQRKSSNSRSETRPLPTRRRSNEGTGFKALDELFSSTSTKPKLYFKPVATDIAEGRLDMLKDLRVGHNDMGRSGDEGMKRYTFEQYRGRDEWVDKGPEFGFGRKGQERLTGYRGRGGGGYRGGRGGDSWRGR